MKTWMSIGRWSWLMMATLTVTAADLQESAYRSSVAQSGIRRDTEQVRLELADIIAEMRANGLQTKELEALAGTETVLTALGDGDMQKVIAALQAASADGGRGTMVEAYRGQKDIALKLQKLAAEFTLQQVLGTLQTRLQNLMLRQAANLRNTEAMGGKFASREQGNAAGALVGVEQKAIGLELGALINNLRSVQAPMAKSVLAALRVEELEGDAQAAKDLAEAGKFAQSAPRQTAVYEALARALLAAAQSQGADAALAAAQDKLAQLAAEQAALKVATESGGDRAALAQQQGRLQDVARLVETMLRGLNAKASAHVAQARPPMGRSRELLPLPPAGTDLAAAQETANTELAAALKLLEKQIAEMQQQRAEDFAKALADLQELAKDIKTAQAAVEKKPDAAQSDTANQLGQRALPLVPAAAQDLFNAAQELQQDAQKNQSAAAQDLASAAAKVDQQVAAMQAAAAQMAQLAAAAEQIANAQGKADAAQNQLQQGDSNGAAQDLMGAQSDLGQVKPDGLPAAANAALQEAGQDLKGAVGAAAKSDPKSSGEQTQKGQAAMQKAQDALNQAMNGIKQQLGMSNTPSSGSGKAKGVGKEGMKADNGAVGPDIVAGFGADANRGSALTMGGLSPKEREAITQSAAQKTPPEYSQAVRQYLKNLSDGEE